MSTRSFKNDSSSVREARKFVAGALAGAPQDLVEVAELMVSELATNCIRHAGSAFEVAVTRGGDSIRVQVTDPGAGEPTVRSPTAEDPTGRGLRIVQALSADWGVERVSTGKAVWFTLETAAVAEAGTAGVTRSSDPGAGTSVRCAARVPRDLIGDVLGAARGMRGLGPAQRRAEITLAGAPAV
jgi:anti-sigma regulatory factor (Ser/Thr protein kinase)